MEINTLEAAKKYFKSRYNGYSKGVMSNIELICDCLITNVEKINSDHILVLDEIALMYKLREEVVNDYTIELPQKARLLVPLSSSIQRYIAQLGIKHTNSVLIDEHNTIIDKRNQWGSKENKKKREANEANDLVDDLISF